MYRQGHVCVSGDLQGDLPRHALQAAAGTAHQLKGLSGALYFKVLRLDLIPLYIPKSVKVIGLVLIVLSLACHLHLQN